MLYVHEQQFLVLLLMVAAELDEFQGRLIQPFGLERLDQGILDVLSVAGDVGDARAGHQSRLRARMPRADRLVVRVEQVPVGGVVLGVGRVGP